MPGDYTFTLQVKYRESKEQTQYVKAQAKSIVGSIVKLGMDEHEKVKLFTITLLSMCLMIRLIKRMQHMKH